ncbi:MAG: ABC transporter ATP-binding protein [Peptococcaceae bacterium]|nr:ABC transporter ATP-binding protein [Peptococcaceae bacterium]
MEPILKLADVRKRFGGVVTADHINMRVFPGEIHGLIGPNGAGKTTALNLISGIYEVDGGTICLGGKDVTRLPAHQRARLGVGRTFQVPRFLRRASIYDNLMIGLDLANQFGFLRSFFGARGDELNALLEPLKEIAGLSFNWEDDIAAMPFGQQKILEIIRALIAKPKVMLIDEPAAGLNSEEILRTMNLIKLVSERGIGVVVIEHKMDLIMNICHNITCINFGKVIGQGAPKEISANPAVIEAYLGKEDDDA